MGIANAKKHCGKSRVRQFVDYRFLAKITATDAPYDSTVREMVGRLN